MNKTALSIQGSVNKKTHLRDKDVDRCGSVHEVVRYLSRFLYELSRGAPSQLSVLRRPERQQPPSVVDDRRKIRAA